ncbi:uncharacterized protein [Musca autumnalis]|uniref:uncharacterized protein n=1 Tax=Musca autumnalis TaxID=221902 RepID=UPI003CEE4C1F
MVRDSLVPIGDIYNTEILTIIFMHQIVDKELIKSVAQSLENIRQSRILIITSQLEPSDEFLRQLLALCELYKMTNVILTSEQFVKSGEFYLLQPYPSFKWQQVRHWEINGKIFYPENWYNMHNKTLFTQPDNSLPQTLVFEDDTGHLQLSGFVAEFIFLFAEYYNVSLQFRKPLKLNGAVHFKEITLMAKEGVLDIPMALDAGGRGNWHDITDTLLLNRVSFMVPLSLQLNVNEIFHLLLDIRFFIIIWVASLVFSSIIALIDYVFQRITLNWKFLVSDEVFPGILGQSFNERFTRIVGLRMIYFFIAYIGFILNTEFSAKVNSYFTSPPYHKQLEKLNDFQDSPIRIQLQAPDAIIMHIWLENWQHIVTITENSSDFLWNRQNFNTSYGYVVQTPLWDIYDGRQQYFRRRVFHTPPAMNLHDIMMWGIPLPSNSPYKEPLNHLIHLVEQSGLMDAWLATVYGHMVKLKLVPLNDPNANKEHLHSLMVEDFYWIWWLLTMALGSDTENTQLSLLPARSRTTRNNRFLFLCHLQDMDLILQCLAPDFLGKSRNVILCLERFCQITLEPDLLSQILLALSQ